MNEGLKVWDRLRVVGIEIRYRIVMFFTVHHRILFFLFIFVVQDTQVSCNRVLNLTTSVRMTLFLLN